jgi:glycosyltransferase involved in cell wall biosynthesis
MRIGIDATALPPRLAGASRYLINLVNHLALIDSDNEYFVFVKRRDADRFLFLAENFHAVLLEDYARPARLLWQTFRPASYARRLHLDLWHAPHYVAPRDLGNCRLVVTFHDLTFMLFPQFYDVSKRLPFQHFIRDAVTRADAIISVSNTTRRDLLRCFPQLGCRSVTIHSGVEERFFQPKGQDGLGELHASVPSGYPFILYVGTLERRKNVPMLVEAFAELIRSTDVPHHLVLVGQPENDLVSVRKAITRNGVTQRVHLAGHVSEADLERLYAGADLFVCPSHYEGFAFPVLEAMASGVPALCSYAGASAEVARHRERFFPPDDPAALARLMQRALSDSTFRRQLVELGRQRAAEFCWQKTAAATRSVYEEVVSNSRSVTRSPAPVSASSDLETALLRTLIYSDLFDYPLTLEELHRGLIGHRAGMT